MTSEGDALLPHVGGEFNADHPCRRQIHSSRGFSGVLLLCGALFLVAVSTRFSHGSKERPTLPVQQQLMEHKTPALDGGAEAASLGGPSTLAPVHVSTAECTGNTSKPVAMGADVVAYRSLQPGTRAVFGSPEYSVLYGVHTFYFSSFENKVLFERDPVRYFPAWGGFCGYGISTEIVWNEDDLGPAINPDYWIIVDDQLYLFRSETPWSKFQSNMEVRIAHGNHVWESWWGHEADPMTVPFNTACFCTVNTCTDG